MREILFRGKTRDDNWYYGVPLVFTEDYVCMTAPYAYSKTVIPETVGQYTGLTDKNRTKIFEGDIVKIIDKHIDLVVFAHGCFCMKYQLFNYEFTYHSSNDIEVIGNITDNPELLGGV